MKLALCIGSRAMWGSGVTIAKHAQAHPDIDLEIWCSASSLLDRYGGTAGQIERTCHNVKRTPDEPIQMQEYTVVRLPSLCEGDASGDMTRTAALTAQAHAMAIEQRKPDALFVIGDRHECLGMAMAARFGGVKLYHSMGGEVSGSVDDRTRDAITALADVHFVANSEARAEVLRKLCRAHETARWMDVDLARKHNVHITGCPRIDAVREATQPADNPYELSGKLADHIMVSVHPDTDEPERSGELMGAVLDATVLDSGKEEVTMHFFWPCRDAGADAMVALARQYVGSGDDYKLYTHRAMPPEDYWRLMATTRCLIGNSSSGIREGAFLGTPVVNVGNRQRGRERAENVIDVPAEADAIAEAIRKQWDHGRYASSDLYGDGQAGKRIVEVIANER